VKKSRFNEAQIIAVLRELEAGSSTAEVCRRHGISEQTFYRWKAKYSGMSVSDAQLKTLEDENDLPQWAAKHQTGGPLPRPRLYIAGDWA
jgi:putative transposase